MTRCVEPLPLLGLSQTPQWLRPSSPLIRLVHSCMSRKRSTACSASTSSSDEAVQLLRDLIQYGIVPPNTHAHAGLLCAAARAVDDGLRRESDPAQLRAYLPPAQRIARLLTWVGYVSALRSMPALSTTATKRLRLAPGRVPAAEQAASSASAEAVA